MFEVFLSYRRETGTEFCSFLYQRLSMEGYNVFFDQKSLRQGVFDEQIDRAISECVYVLVMLASGDLDRCFKDPENDWILHEIRLAMHYGKIVIPVKINQHFFFDAHYELPELAFLGKQELCDLSGADAASLIDSKLLGFMATPPSAALAEAYNKGVLGKEYLQWEIETLQTIYPDLEFVQEFRKVFPIVVFPGSKKVKYPFDELNDPELLEDISDPVEIDDSDVVDDFKMIVGPNIHFPNLYGFTNVGLIFDEENNVQGFRAKPRTYRETVFSGHILHYELWHAFKLLSGLRPGTLDDLPLRRKIHGGQPNLEILTSGCRRSSLCDICIAVLAYDEIEDDYALAVATRSKQVACYPGYLGIVPSGGFELYELESKQTPLVIKKNFSILAALFREYIEEIFGDENFDKPTGNDDLKRLYRNPHVQEIRRQIGKTCFFEFLGVTVDVISLRPTFAFVLRIDDPKFLYENEIKKNQENIDVRFISLNDFEESVVESECSSPLMAESAGVYRLLKMNHLFQETRQHMDKDVR